MRSNFLQKILLHKRQEIEAHRSTLSEGDLHHMLRGIAPARPLDQAIEKAKNLAIIAELKKASPSAGLICEEYLPVQIAQSYADAGAEALSILTDERYFLGSISHINQIRPKVDIPILRKDFMIDPYQILEARAFGADAVLLIVAAVEGKILSELLDAAQELNLQAIVEVHNQSEMATALHLGAKIIGINNRNLETFKVDLTITEELAPMVSQETLLVAESGIHSAEDVQRMAGAGVHAILVGTHFMQQDNPGEALQRLKKVQIDVAGQNLRHHAA